MNTFKSFYNRLNQFASDTLHNTCNDIHSNKQQGLDKGNTSASKDVQSSNKSPIVSEGSGKRQQKASTGFGRLHQNMLPKYAQHNHNSIQNHQVHQQQQSISYAQFLGFCKKYGIDPKNCTTVKKLGNTGNGIILKGNAPFIIKGSPTKVTESYVDIPYRTAFESFISWIGGTDKDRLPMWLSAFNNTELKTSDFKQKQERTYSRGVIQTWIKRAGLGTDDLDIIFSNKIPEWIVR